MQPGVWRLSPVTISAPMGPSMTTLVITGLDMGEALSRLPDAFRGDRHQVRAFLTVIEAGALAGVAASAGRSQEGAG